MASFKMLMMYVVKEASRQKLQIAQSGKGSRKRVYLPQREFRGFVEGVLQVSRHTGCEEGAVVMGSWGTSSGKGKKHPNTDNNKGTSPLLRVYCEQPTADYFTWIF